MCEQLSLRVVPIYLSIHRVSRAFCHSNDSLSFCLSQNRPPRVKRFSARRLLKWLSGSDSQKPQPKEPQPANSGTYVHPPVSTTDPVPVGPRRTTSFPSTSDPRRKSTESQRPASMEVSSTPVTARQRSSLPPTYRSKKGGSGHKRRYSGGNIPKSQVEGYELQRPSSPTHPPLFVAEHIRPFTEGLQKMIDQDTLGSRVRSLSHPRSPSPHLQPLGGRSLHSTVLAPTPHIITYM